MAEQNLKDYVVSEIINNDTNTNFKNKIETFFDNIPLQQNLNINSDSDNDNTCEFIDDCCKEEQKNKRLCEKLNKYENLKNNTTSKSGKYLYINACNHLFENIDDLIFQMIYNNKKFANKEYVLYYHRDFAHVLAFVTADVENTEINKILLELKQHNYDTPFSFVKNIMKKKGYYLNVVAEKTDDIHKIIFNLEIHATESGKRRQRNK